MKCHLGAINVNVYGNRSQRFKYLKPICKFPKSGLKYNLLGILFKKWFVGAWIYTYSAAGWPFMLDILDRFYLSVHKMASNTFYHRLLIFPCCDDFQFCNHATESKWTCFFLIIFDLSAQINNNLSESYLSASRNKKGYVAICLSNKTTFNLLLSDSLTLAKDACLFGCSGSILSYVQSERNVISDVSFWWRVHNSVQVKTLQITLVDYEVKSLFLFNLHSFSNDISFPKPIKKICTYCRVYVLIIL